MGAVAVAEPMDAAITDAMMPLRDEKKFNAFQLNLGHRIRLLRLSRNLTQVEVAKRLEISRVAVGYIEQGRRLPSLSTLYGLAEIYNMSIAELCDIDSSLAKRN